MPGPNSGLHGLMLVREETARTKVVLWSHVLVVLTRAYAPYFSWSWAVSFVDELDVVLPSALRPVVLFFPFRVFLRVRRVGGGGRRVAAFRPSQEVSSGSSVLWNLSSPPQRRGTTGTSNDGQRERQQSF